MGFRRWLAPPGGIDALTPVGVPFELPLQRSGAHDGFFVERATATRNFGRGMLFIGGLNGFFTAVLLWLWLSDPKAAPSDVESAFAFMSAATVFFLGLGWWGIARARVRDRVLVISGRPPVASLRSRAGSETARGLGDCDLRIHPVRLAIYWRLGRPVLHWTGFAVIMHIADDRFVLACQKSREAAERYVLRMPAEIGRILRSDGPHIEAAAHKRVW